MQSVLERQAHRRQARTLVFWGIAARQHVRCLLVDAVIPKGAERPRTRTDTHGRTLEALLDRQLQCGDVTAQTHGTALVAPVLRRGGACTCDVDRGARPG